MCKVQTHERGSFFVRDRGKRRERKMAEEKSRRGVLPDRLGGGPHGLGDPDDRTLRKVEAEVLIPKKMREKAKAEKCADVVKEFSKCCADTGVLMVYKCREENTALRSCLEKWYNDEEFKKECRNEYLTQRSNYRRTGIKQKHLGSNRLPTSM